MYWPLLVVTNFLGIFSGSQVSLAKEVKRYGFQDLVEARQASNPGDEIAENFALSENH